MLNVVYLSCVIEWRKSHRMHVYEEPPRSKMNEHRSRHEASVAIYLTPGSSTVLGRSPLQSQIRRESSSLPEEGATRETGFGE